MSSIFKVGSQAIKIGKGWVSAEGIQHPSTWGLWSSEEKKTAGISEIVLQELPDSRLYNATHEDDGSVNSTAKNLADTTIRQSLLIFRRIVMLFVAKQLKWKRQLMTLAILVR